MPTDPKATSVRTDEDTDRLWEALARQLGVKKSDVLRLAIRLLARREGVK